MSEVITQAGAEAQDGVAIDWSDMVEGLSRQLQLDRGDEGEGWDGLTTFVRSKVFESEPQNAVSLYAALAASKDPFVRREAVDGLDKLTVLDPETSAKLLEQLMTDEDDMVRGHAYHIATQYG